MAVDIGARLNRVVRLRDGGGLQAFQAHLLPGTGTLCDLQARPSAIMRGHR
jgi:hypothetical protein